MMSKKTQKKTTVAKPVAVSPVITRAHRQADAQVAVLRAAEALNQAVKNASSLGLEVRVNTERKPYAVTPLTTTGKEQRPLMLNSTAVEVVSFSTGLSADTFRTDEDAKYGHGY